MQVQVCVCVWCVCVTVNLDTRTYVLSRAKEVPGQILTCLYRQYNTSIPVALQTYIALCIHNIRRRLKLQLSCLCLLSLSFSMGLIDFQEEPVRRENVFEHDYQTCSDRLGADKGFQNGRRSEGSGGGKVRKFAKVNMNAIAISVCIYFCVLLRVSCHADVLSSFVGFAVCGVAELQVPFWIFIYNVHEAWCRLCVCV